MTLSLSNLITISYAYVLLLSFSNNYLFVNGVCQKLLIPAYFYPEIWSPPTNYWNKLIGSSNTVSIMNPNNGPEVTLNTDYNTSVTQVRQSGGTVIGYVYTSYGQRNIVDVKSDVSAYFAQYKIDGIFFDEVSQYNVDINYYTDIISYVRSFNPKYVVVLNPGVYPDEAYIPLADIVVTFEDDYNLYMNSFSALTYAGSYPSSKFAHIIYNVPNNITLMSQVMTLSATRNAGNIFITDDILPNPYDTLPPYFQSEVNNVLSACGITKVPTVSPTFNPSKSPTKSPSKKPTLAPSKLPSKRPTINPSKKPSKKPTVTPSRKPSKAPV